MGFLKFLMLLIIKTTKPMNNSNDDLESLIRSASPDGHRSELIPVTITPEMAKGYLSFGLEQERKIDQAVTEDYAQTMRNGEWKAGSVLIFWR
jgi:hypothetical protein